MVQNSLRPPAGDDSGVSRYTNFSHEATPPFPENFLAVSVGCPDGFLPVPEFPAGAGGRKERGVSSPSLLLASQYVNPIAGVYIQHKVSAKQFP